MASWRSTWQPNPLHTMASDPPAMNHPSDVLTCRRFVSDWLGLFTPLCCACARKTICTFGQVNHGKQSLQPVTTETTHCAYAAYTGAPL